MLTVTPVFAAPVESTAAGRIEFHPRYRAWLGKCGITSAADVLALRGEVVCGHADRHVVKVELHSGVSVRGAYLKREHVVGHRSRFCNWRDGFGWVSRAEREARTLQKLEDLGIPGPQWLAFGHDAEGRAFVLIEELTGMIPLRDLLADYSLSADERRLLAERLGRMLAECHSAGIGTPELAAKHVLVRPGALQPTLIDWQSSRNNPTISESEATAWFGALRATSADEAVNLRDRLRMLWAYRRVMKASGTPPSQRCGAFARAIRDASREQLKRSSVRQQLGVRDATPQRLVWLDGEAFVAIPEIAGAWSKSPACEPFYDLPVNVEPITLPCGTKGELTRYRTVDPLGRIVAAIRERPWRSPGAKAARVCFHLQRFGIPGPKLLAFGQRWKSMFEMQSFVVVRACDRSRIDESITPDNPLRNRTLADIGQLLKRLHDASCRFHRVILGAKPLLVLTPELGVASTGAVSIVRRLSPGQARADLARALTGMDHLDKMRVLRSYLGSGAADHTEWDRFARAVL